MMPRLWARQRPGTSGPLGHSCELRLAEGNGLKIAASTRDYRLAWCCAWRVPACAIVAQVPLRIENGQLGKFGNPCLVY